MRGKLALAILAVALAVSGGQGVAAEPPPGPSAIEYARSMRWCTQGAMTVTEFPDTDSVDFTMQRAYAMLTREQRRARQSEHLMITFVLPEDTERPLHLSIQDPIDRSPAAVQEWHLEVVWLAGCFHAAAEIGRWPQIEQDRARVRCNVLGGAHCQP